MRALTKKQQAYVHAYRSTQNMLAAFQAAGYSAAASIESQRRSAKRVHELPHVYAAIQAFHAEDSAREAARSGCDAEYVRREWADTARMDPFGVTMQIRDALDRGTSPPPEAAKFVKSIKPTKYGHEITLLGRDWALDQLARHYGMFVDKSEQTMRLEGADGGSPAVVVNLGIEPDSARGLRRQRIDERRAAWRAEQAAKAQRCDD